MSKKSPTQRSLESLRADGWTCDIVERWVPAARKRKDLLGIGDIFCIRDEEVLIVQTTSGSNVSARVKKIADSQHIGAIRKAGILVHVHGWAKNSKGRWTLRTVDCS